MDELKTLIDDFLAGIEPRVSLNTWKAYRSDMKTLSEQLNKLGDLESARKLRDARMNMIEQYSSKTVARKWSAWREFARYCQNVGLIQSNPIFELNVDIPNRKRTLAANIDHNLVCAICDRPASIRDKSLLWFLYSTGIRISEFGHHAIFKNLNLAAEEFTLPDRTCFLSHQCIKHLKVYLQTRPIDSLGLDSHIFVNDDSSPLREIYVYNLFRTMANSLGIKATYKNMRDVLSAELINKSAKPEEVTYLMGYKTTISLEPFLELIETKN